MSTKQKVIAIATALVLACAAFGYFIAYPLSTDILALNQQIDDERVALEQSYERGQNIRIVRKTFNRIRDDAAVLDTVFLDPAQELAFLDTLEQLAKDAGVEFSINVLENPPQSKNKTETKKPASVSYTITTQGTFQNVVRFLVAIEREDVYVIAPKIDVQGTGLDRVRATLNTTIYTPSPD